MEGAWVRSLVGHLRSHMLSGMTERLKKLHILCCFDLCAPFKCTEPHLTELSVARVNSFRMGMLLKGKKVRCGFGHFWQWLMRCWSSVNWVEVLERLIKVAESGTEQRRMSLLSAILSSGFQWKSQEKIVADSRLAVLVYLFWFILALYWTDTSFCSITPPNSQYYCLY